jgi:WD40 repeat protein
MDGKSFATAGQSGIINIYDDETKAVTLQCRGDTRRIGHTSRIYSVRYHPEITSMLISGGWDNTVLVWDLRTGATVRTIYGPHICGEAIDIHPFSHILLTASWQPKDALQTWDLSSGKVIETIPYNIIDEEIHQPNDMLYSCAYSADGNWLAAGGCGFNDAKLMPLSTATVDAKTPITNPWVDCVSLRGGVYSVSFSPNGSKLIVGGSDVNFAIVDL